MKPDMEAIKAQAKLEDEAEEKDFAKLQEWYESPECKGMFKPIPAPADAAA